MKVKELMEELAKLDPERQVILQKDPEGNGWSPLSRFWLGAYRAESTWHGKAGFEPGTLYQ